MRIINHKKNNFPPRNQEDLTAAMLKQIARRKPAYAFVIEWPSDGSMPKAHTSTEDLPVLAFRLQNILTQIYGKKNVL